MEQGADDTTNALNIRRCFARVAGAPTTEATAEASIVQTRHRVPEDPLREGQIIVYQVPQPEPLRPLEPREVECRKLHAYRGISQKYFRSEEHTSELQSLMRISYAVFCLKKNKNKTKHNRK